MAKIIFLDDEFVTVKMTNGTCKEYSREKCDFDPKLGDEVDFSRNAQGGLIVVKVGESVQSASANTKIAAEHHEERKRYCTNCGAELKTDDKFCTLCGCPVESEDKNHAVGVSGENHVPNEANAYQRRSVGQPENLVDHRNQPTHVPPPGNAGRSYAAGKPKERSIGSKILTGIGVAAFLLFFLSLVGSGSKSKAASGSSTSQNTASTAALNEEKADTASVNTAPAESKTIVSGPSYEETDKHFEVFKQEFSDSYRYSAFVEITNTGTENIHASNVSFDIEDGSGHLIQTDSFVSTCPDIIAPGKVGYIYLWYSSELAGVAFPDGLVFVPHYNMETTLSAPTVLDVSDTSLKSGETTLPTITGRVTNNSGSDVSIIYLQAIAYGADGKVIGITGTTLTDLANGTTQSFNQVFFELNQGKTIGDIANYKVIAQTPYYGW